VPVDLASDALRGGSEADGGNSDTMWSRLDGRGEKLSLEDMDI
jgi:hypothetical protein